MPAYSFKERFIPFILDGSKSHTIRSQRGGSGHAKPGQTVFIYYGMRTKHCRKIGEGICDKVLTVKIFKNKIELSNRNGNEIFLVGLTADQFAWKDGFRLNDKGKFFAQGCFELMTRFFEQNGGLPFEGVLIHWKDFVPAPGKGLVEKINQ